MSKPEDKAKYEKKKPLNKKDLQYDDEDEENKKKPHHIQPYYPYIPEGPMPYSPYKMPTLAGTENSFLYRPVKLQYFVSKVLDNQGHRWAD